MLVVQTDGINNGILYYSQTPIVIFSKFSGFPQISVPNLQYFFHISLKADSNADNYCYQLNEGHFS